MMTFFDSIILLGLVLMFGSLLIDGDISNEEGDNDE